MLVFYLFALLLQYPGLYLDDLLQQTELKRDVNGDSVVLRPTQRLPTENLVVDAWDYQAL